MACAKSSIVTMSGSPNWANAGAMILSQTIGKGPSTNVTQRIRLMIA